jgi:hypothetical protein
MRTAEELPNRGEFSSLVFWCVKFQIFKNRKIDASIGDNALYRRPHTLKNELKPDLAERSGVDLWTTTITLLCDTSLASREKNYGRHLAQLGQPVSLGLDPKDIFERMRREVVFEKKTYVKTTAVDPARAPQIKCKIEFFLPSGGINT